MLDVQFRIDLKQTWFEVQVFIVRKYTMLTRRIAGLRPAFFSPFGFPSHETVKRDSYRGRTPKMVDRTNTIMNMNDSSYRGRTPKKVDRTKQNFGHV